MYLMNLNLFIYLSYVSIKYLNFLSSQNQIQIYELYNVLYCDNKIKIFYYMSMLKYIIVHCATYKFKKSYFVNVNN